MNTIHLMVGIQGSGKSTFSKKLSEQLNIIIASTDEVRKQNKGIDEQLVWPLAYKMCADELKKGKDVIFDATSITPKVRARLINNIKELYDSFEIGCYYFDVKPEICKERVRTRNNIEGELYLPLEVIDSYHERLIKPTLDEGLTFIKVIDYLGNVIEIIE